MGVFPGYQPTRTAEPLRTGLPPKKPSSPEAVVFNNKYNRPCKGVTIDVYDVLQAFEVTNPALQHLIKKALCAGLRGHKNREQDLNEILESAKRAIELESK